MSKSSPSACWEQSGRWRWDKYGRQCMCVSHRSCLWLWLYVWLWLIRRKRKLTSHTHTSTVSVCVFVCVMIHGGHLWTWLVMWAAEGTVRPAAKRAKRRTLCRHCRVNGNTLNMKMKRNVSLKICFFFNYVHSNLYRPETNSSSRWSKTPVVDLPPNSTRCGCSALCVHRVSASNTRPF